MPNKPSFRFRLNGIVIPELRIQREVVGGQAAGAVQIAVRDETIGWFAIDDNSRLCDQDLPRFVLEYRNETEWQQADALRRQIDHQHGWHTVSPRRLVAILQHAGYVRRP